MEKNNQRNSKLLIVLLILFVISTAVFIWLYSSEKTEKEEIVSVLTEEKTDLQNELSELVTEYDSLKTYNDTLQTKLNDERNRVANLLEEVKKIKSSNAAQIRKYKKELKTLRDIMKNYVVQIDSLNTLNQELIAENEQVKSDIARARKNNKELEKTNENLSNKVAMASVLQAKYIEVSPMNKRSRETNRAKRLQKIKTCFVLADNKLIEAGSKEVYIRIVRPDDLILAKSETNLFLFEDQEIVYSSTRIVEYNQKETDVCIWWESSEEYIPGRYSIDIFADNHLIGTVDFEMK